MTGIQKGKAWKDLLFYLAAAPWVSKLCADLRYRARGLRHAQFEFALVHQAQNKAMHLYLTEFMSGAHMFIIRTPYPHQPTNPSPRHVEGREGCVGVGCS